MKTLLPALFFLLATGSTAYAAHRLVRSRRGGATGAYWSFVGAWVVALLAPATLISGWLESLWPTGYQSGRHLQLDLTGAFGWSLATCYLVALGVPLALWLLLLGLGLRGEVARVGAPPWLAGGVGLEASRRWLLTGALPVVGLALCALPRLGGGPSAYPAASWALLALLACTLVAAAMGEGVERAAAARRHAPVAKPVGLPDWPKTMVEGGLRLRALGGWPAQATATSPRGDAARRFSEQLALLGAKAVAPALVETVAELLAARPGQTRARVVLAPDGCGQEEVVGLAAHLLGRRCRAHTLVVAAGGADLLAARLGRWLPAGGAVAIGRATEIPPAERVWVVDVETLSDHLLPHLRDPRRCERLGLVVWWGLHEASGVPAASLWAISRRLHRLLAAHGRRDLRTLAFLRRAPQPEARATAFVQRLLPVALDSGAIVEIGMSAPRAVALHLIEPPRSELLATGSASGGAGEALRLPPPLAAASVSAAAGWPTHLDLPAEQRGELEPRLRQLAASSAGARLVDDPAAAGARIRALAVADVAALPEILAQGGRAAMLVGQATHHVGLLAPVENPYAVWLLEHFGTGSASPMAHRLLWAEPRGELMRRHLLLALAELPDTREGLLRDFLLDEELVRSGLEQVAREGNLSRREVRRVDAANRLLIEQEHQIRRLGERGEHPSSVLGRSPIELRDPAAAGAVCARVDRGRLTVEAYPHRVFTAAGRRYRVDEWGSLGEVLERGWLACTREDAPWSTWRRRHATVYDLVPQSAPVTVGGGGRAFSRGLVGLCYEEEVSGVILAGLRAGTGPVRRPEARLLDVPIRATLDTRALVLGLRRPEGSEELAELGPAALCEALRHVLPVRLGVESDVLEPVPLSGEESAEGTYGIAIVELYAGGIGLIDALQGDDACLSGLLRATREWLESCRCAGGRGCHLDTPSARATALDQLPDHRAALAVLRHAV